jgi:D-alanyl-D-alanine carboxypeptidase/D-alanyl-D-alanine-endopeptidase (penicillin-binding protein 4)
MRAQRLVLHRRNDARSAISLVLAPAVTAVFVGVGAPHAATQPAADAGSSEAIPIAGMVLRPYPIEPIPPGSLPTPTATAPSPGPSGSASPQTADDFPGDRLDPDRVRATMEPLLRGGALGPGRTPTSVVDVGTGAVLYRTADRPTTPASTAKLVTAVSALDALGADKVLTTRAALLDPETSARRVVLVGAGDPTLSRTAGRVGGSGTSIVPASLRRLARATAAELGPKATVRIGYDDTLFTGPALHPTWSRSFPAGGVVAPVSALQVDEGRRTRGSVTRVANPARVAAERFADELERAGVQVAGQPSRTPLRADSADLASVTSPSVGVLVERMLSTSDNDIAESLARLAAHAAGFPASFAGVAQRARQVLEGIGPVAAADVLVDGSGLSRSNRLSPSTLTTLLREHPEGPLASGLPVAAATGSLRNRFATSRTQAAAGLARLKTGTLTGVIALAGLVSRPDGRLLAVALVDGNTAAGAVASRAALDRAVAALVRCKCSASTSGT